jgi:hypothetical protein
MSRKQTATKLTASSDCPPNAAETAAICEASQRVRNRKPRLVAVCKQSSAGRIETLGPKHNDRTGWLSRLQDAFGTNGTEFAIAQLNKLISVSRTTDGKVDHVSLNGLLAMIEGAEPQNEVQAALAVQMALTHAVAQHVLLRASRVDQIPQFDSASNAAVKLLRTFAMQAEVLAKLQRGGEQVVKVVHVHSGAQAIVGNVVQHAPRDGGGVIDDNSNQPHAKAELPTDRSERMPKVFSTDSQRQPMPLAVGQR